MPQCNVCMADIDEETDTHIEVVKPMEFKGNTEEIRHYYCSVKCLVDHAQN
jgi:hypothetical protein